MRQRFVVIFRPQALRQMDEARAWWAEHRGTRAFDDALARTLDRLEQFPYSAPRAQIAGRWSTMRRAAFGRTGYRLYYRPNKRTKTILVASIWHERRPGMPAL